jgi:glycine hydroxymethyltransferase
MSSAEHNAPVFDLLSKEHERQSQCLTLIASENHSSGAVREALASVLTDKYAEGYPGRRYYGGCEVGDEIERLARDRARELFQVDWANVQPHSGTQANIHAYLSVMKPGDPMVAMSLNAGGHLSHGYKVNHTGKLFDVQHYGLDESTGLIDYDEVERLAKEHKPKVLVAGGSAYPRLIDWARFRAIADEVGAVFMADIAHPAGMIAAGVIPSPVGHAQLVTMTTHKTLRGPRGGMILCDEELKKKVNSSVFPGGQGGPFLHAIAGKAIAFGDALQPAFRAYQEQVAANAKALGEAMLGYGYELVTGGTDTHLILVDLRPKGLSGAEVEDRCRAANLVVNKNLIPGDPRPAQETSGLRLGTPAVTTRGMKVEQIQELASCIDRLVSGGDAELPAVSAKIAELAEAYPLPQ